MNKISKKRMGIGLGIIMCIVVLFFLLKTYSPISRSAPAWGSNHEGVSVSATDLYFDYYDNPIWANETYKDSILVVTGTIYEISTFLNRPCISLVGDEQITEAVVCLFGDDVDIAEIAKLSAGDTVTIQGRCDGPPYSRAPIWLKSCILPG